MNDKALLEAAARVIGIEHPGGDHCVNGPGLWDIKRRAWWKPLTNRGDANGLRDALSLVVEVGDDEVCVHKAGRLLALEPVVADATEAAECRAIVRAAVAGAKAITAGVAA